MLSAASEASGGLAVKRADVVVGDDDGVRALCAAGG